MMLLVMEALQQSPFNLEFQDNYVHAYADSVYQALFEPKYEARLG